MLEPTNLTPVEMNTTRSAVLEKNEKIVVKEITTPELQPDECEVGIFSAGLCSSDIERGFGGGAYFYPLVMGHELAGEITRIGSNIGEGLSVGDKVCIFPLLPCFKCPACKEKRYALCRNYDYYGSRRHGGFAEKLNVKKWNLCKLPDGVDLEDGAFVEPMAVVLHAIEKLDLNSHKPGRLCILGGGFLGLVAVQIINQLYPESEILLVDRNQFKLDIGSQCGAATRWIGDADSWDSFLADMDRAFDQVIELVGSPETFGAALQVAAPGARVVWGGNISGDLNLTKAQVSSVLRKELIILGTWNSIYKGDGICDWTRCLDLISRGIQPSDFVSLRIDLDELDATLSKLHAHKQRKVQFDIIKVLVKPNKV